MLARQTYSRSHVLRQETAHARADGYGRHRHLYLHDTLRRLAKDIRLRQGGEVPLTWLDYGCGKGAFMDEVRSLAIFDSITGYDPAVQAYRQKPAITFDVVTCLDVLDIVESRFVGAVLSDLANMITGVAIIDCLTRPKPGGALRPHAPFFWVHLVRRHMRIVDTTVEFPGMDGFERVIITANSKPV